jgi:hypothetical protein
VWQRAEFAVPASVQTALQNGYDDLVFVIALQTQSLDDPYLLDHFTFGPAASGGSDATCNGIDEDCDGAVDEDYVPVATSCGVGACAAAGATVCTVGQEVDACEPGQPAALDNICDGVDDDCDGAIDEDCSGECDPGDPLTFDDGNPCTADSCDPVEGAMHTPVSAGTPCDDNDVCNGDETCDGAGTCQAGTPLDPDDANVCTVDGCDPQTGVFNVPGPAGTPCEDADLCNGDEACDAGGVCAAGTPPTVDDGNVCTADSCDPVLGVVHTPVSAGISCADGNVCNGDETCDGSAVCQAGTPLDLDDGNPCTADSCDPITGVAHTPVAAGTACADSDLCNGDETCDGAGACVAGAPPVVDDGNVCTADSCDPVQGVVHAAMSAGTSCSDSNVCNGDETCDGAGACAAGTPLDPDDGNPCTVDSCDPVAGVDHTPLPDGSSCGDGDVCNGDELCDGSGVCNAGTPLDVDDGNACTDDACDPGTGAVNTPVADGTACGPQGFFCTAGECTGVIPDPEEVATEPDLTVQQPFAELTEFLYAGPEPVQFGVEPDAIDPVRVAVLRGKVLDTDGNPLAGIRVTVHDHEELGETMSRADGRYDIAVNGGGVTTVSFTSPNHMRVDRTVSVPWTDYRYTHPGRFHRDN